MLVVPGCLCFWTAQRNDPLHMPAEIQVTREHLYYRDGAHLLSLPVEWSGVAKTEDCPIDFEISACDLANWTEPAGEPIEPARREELLDQIADYYSRAPAADIIGERGQLLRGVSKFRFYLHIPPEPSHYYEVGRFLAVPMAPPAKGAKFWHEKYVADLRGITHWTSPPGPLDREHLALIARRIARSHGIGITGAP
jgi:hypothetical protein